LDEEILKTTRTVVVEKTDNKVIKEQKKEEKRAALSAILSKTDVKTIEDVKSTQQKDGSFELSWSWGKYITDTAKSTIEGIIQVGKQTIEKADYDHEIEDIEGIFYEI
jgi:hypothetical protein